MKGGVESWGCRGGRDASFFEMCYLHIVMNSLLVGLEWTVLDVKVAGVEEVFFCKQNM